MLRSSAFLLFQLSLNLGLALYSQFSLELSSLLACESISHIDDQTKTPLTPATRAKYFSNDLMLEGLISGTNVDFSRLWKRYYGDLPPVEIPYTMIGYALPGSGTPLDSCETTKWKTYCPACKKFKNDIQNYCYRSECPKCTHKWRKRATMRSSDRVFWMSVKLNRSPSSQRRPRYIVRHVIFSPEPGSYTHMKKIGKKWLTPMQQMRRHWLVVKEIACKGIKGGIAIPHPWRFRNTETGDSVPWKHASCNPNAKSPIESAKPVFQPHVHCVMVGWLIPGVELKEKTERLLGVSWIWKSPLESRELETKESIQSVIDYQLSHTGIKLGVVFKRVSCQNKKTGKLYSRLVRVGYEHSVVYFGECSYNRFIVYRKFTWKLSMICQDCGTVLILFSPEGRDLKTEYTRLITWRYYRFKTKSRSSWMYQRTLFRHLKRK